MPGRLIILCGLPGSGKTTLARHLEHRSTAVRLSADEWMQALSINLHAEAQRASIEALQWRFATRLLTVGTVVIIEWGSWSRKERNVLREGARQLGVAVELHYLTAPVEELYRRIQLRNAESPAIPFEAVRYWSEQLETPTPEEFALFDAPLF